MVPSPVDSGIGLASIAEACALLRISRTFIYDLMKRGEIKSVKIGRRTLVPLREIQRMCAIS